MEDDTWESLLKMQSQYPHLVGKVLSRGGACYVHILEGLNMSINYGQSSEEEDLREEKCSQSIFQPDEFQSTKVCDKQISRLTCGGEESRS